MFLLVNNFYRGIPDDPEPSAAAQALPQMGGSGWVRDLRKAMSLEMCSVRYRKSSKQLRKDGDMAHIPSRESCVRVDFASRWVNGFQKPSQNSAARVGF
ncbi:hypothetical protein M5C99_13805 [Acidovorax sp. NCPPB 2350]|nr:hypothetical protein M5C99_13805 [Acidovorax sp. NCPPB 2350]